MNMHANLECQKDYLILIEMLAEWILLLNEQFALTHTLLEHLLQTPANTSQWLHGKIALTQDDQLQFLTQKAEKDLTALNLTTLEVEETLREEIEQMQFIHTSKA